MSTGSPDEQSIFFVNQPVLSSSDFISVVYVIICSCLFVYSYCTSVGVSMKILDNTEIFKTVDGSFLSSSFLSLSLFLQPMMK